MKNGHLPSYLGWLAYKFKLWSNIVFGIGTMTNDIEDVKDLLEKQEYETMNYLGVASTIKAGLTTLHSTFGESGLQRLVTEQLIQRLYILQQHYENGSSLSQNLAFL